MQQTLLSLRTARLLTARVLPNSQELARTTNELLTGLAFSGHNAKLSGKTEAVGRSGLKRGVKFAKQMPRFKLSD